MLRSTALVIESTEPKLAGYKAAPPLVKEASTKAQSLTGEIDIADFEGV